jgi:hypothetical protein
MAMLLTKPNATLLALGFLALALVRSRWRPLVWALVTLAVLSTVGTLAFPGWFRHLSEPGFGRGLIWLTDGPDRIVSRRRLCTAVHWLEGLGVGPTAAWIIYGGLWLLVAGLAWWSWTDRTDHVFWASLGVVATLLVTPYALLYDYVPLAVGLLWVYRSLPPVSGAGRWIVFALLAFAFSVLVWAGPESDGYWLALAMAALLVTVQRSSRVRPAADALSGDAM